MATKKVKKVSAKKVSAKNKVNIDFKDSINKIKDTAINVNSQVMNAAGDVVEELRENSDQVRAVATNRAKKVITKVAETVNIKNFKTAAKDVNNYTLKTAEEIVDGALVSGEKWQGIATKAVNGSLKLAAKNQDIMFDTLDTVKGQLINTASRLRKIFSNN